MKKKSLKKTTAPSKNSKLILVLVVLLTTAGAIAWYFNSKKTSIAPHQINQVAQASDQSSPFQKTIPNSGPAPAEAPEGMVWIPGGEFSMGAEDPRGIDHGGPDPMGDARPIHRVYVDGFWMDTTEVTNEQFARFAKATGYKTVAERTPRAEDFPEAPPENLVAGSVVFAPTSQPVPLNNHDQWFAYIKGANWRHPLGSVAESRAWKNIRLFTLHMKMRKLMRSGQENAFQQKRNGSLQHAAG